MAADTERPSRTDQGETAAGSALGRMVIRLGKAAGFRTINVVRRKELAAELKQLGADEVVISTNGAAMKKHLGTFDMILDTASVLKSLYYLSLTKPLSFREKKMLERAKYLLISELATARNTTEANVEASLVKALAKAKLQFPISLEKPELE